MSCSSIINRLNINTQHLNADGALLFIEADTVELDHKKRKITHAREQQWPTECMDNLRNYFNGVSHTLYANLEGSDKRKVEWIAKQMTRHNMGSTARRGEMVLYMYLLDLPYCKLDGEVAALALDAGFSLPQLKVILPIVEALHANEASIEELKVTLQRLKEILERYSPSDQEKILHLILKLMIDSDNPFMLRRILHTPAEISLLQVLQQAAPVVAKSQCWVDYDLLVRIYQEPTIPPIDRHAIFEALVQLPTTDRSLTLEKIIPLHGIERAQYIEDINIVMAGEKERGDILNKLFLAFEKLRGQGNYISSVKGKPVKEKRCLLLLYSALYSREDREVLINFFKPYYREDYYGSALEPWITAYYSAQTVDRGEEKLAAILSFLKDNELVQVPFFFDQIHLDLNIETIHRIFSYVKENIVGKVDWSWVDIHDVFFSNNYNENIFAATSFVLESALPFDTEDKKCLIKVISKSNDLEKAKAKEAISTVVPSLQNGFTPNQIVLGIASLLALGKPFWKTHIPLLPQIMGYDTCFAWDHLTERNVKKKVRNIMFIRSINPNIDKEIMPYVLKFYKLLPIKDRAGTTLIIETLKNIPSRYLEISIKRLPDYPAMKAWIDFFQLALPLIQNNNDDEKTDHLCKLRKIPNLQNYIPQLNLLDNLNSIDRVPMECTNEQWEILLADALIKNKKSCPWLIQITNTYINNLVHYLPLICKQEPLMRYLMYRFPTVLGPHLEQLPLNNMEEATVSDVIPYLSPGKITQYIRQFPDADIEAIIEETEVLDNFSSNPVIAWLEEKVEDLEYAISQEERNTIIDEATRKIRDNITPLSLAAIHHRYPYLLAPFYMNSGNACPLPLFHQ